VTVHSDELNELQYWHLLIIITGVTDQKVLSLTQCHLYVVGGTASTWVTAVWSALRSTWPRTGVLRAF